jgi:hypothetical protein
VYWTGSFATISVCIAIRQAGDMHKIRGTSKQDRLRDTDKNDLVLARGGDDRILTLSGHDVIYGKEGDDKVVAATTDAFEFYGGSGRDVLELYARPKDMPAVLKVNGEIIGVTLGDDLIELDGVERVAIHYVNDWPF